MEARRGRLWAFFLWLIFMTSAQSTPYLILKTLPRSDSMANLTQDYEVESGQRSKRFYDGNYQIGWAKNYIDRWKNNDIDRWYKNKITYRIDNRPSCCITEEEIRSLIREAFNQWSLYSGLMFYEVFNMAADITIKFVLPVSGYPSDEQIVDLAEASMPGTDSYIHFNYEIPWTGGFTLKFNGYRGSEGRNFFYVALHETGHIIGLPHLPLRYGVSPVMVDNYNKYYTVSGQVQLTCDDKISALQLYGINVYPTECLNNNYNPMRPYK